MKKKLMIDLPDNFIDEETKKIIKQQKNLIAKLENKVKKLEAVCNLNYHIVERAKRLVDACRDAGEFHLYGED